MAIPGAPSDSSTPLGDLFSGINRPQLNAFVANSQAKNGLVSAQTQEAMIKASQAQEQMAAWDRIKADFAAKGASDSDASLARDGVVGASNHDAVNAEKLIQASNSAVLGNPALMGTTQQTAAQQGYQGKVAEPNALPNNFTTLPGTPPIVPQQSPQGAAQTAQTTALTGADVARAELEHANAKKATLLGNTTLSPQALDEAARVTMADPTKMSTYAGYGASGQVNKDAINNRRAQMLNDAGMTTDNMMQQRAITKASVGAAGQAAKQQQTLEAFMPLIKSNGDRVLQLMDQIDAAGGPPDEPIINGFSRVLGRNLNSDDLAELHSVLTGYQAEVGRLLAAGPSMNGVISNHARDLVNGMAPENMSADQARRVINRIDTEINIRHAGVHASLEAAANAQVPVMGPQQQNLPPTTTTPAATNLPPGFRSLN